MHKLFLSVLLVASLALLQVAGQLEPPERPSEFRGPNELRQYLRALNEYYAIVGRPRFGRSVRSSKRAVDALADNLRADDWSYGEQSPWQVEDVEFKRR